MGAGYSIAYSLLIAVGMSTFINGLPTLAVAIGLAFGIGMGRRSLAIAALVYTAITIIVLLVTVVPLGGVNIGIATITGWFGYALIPYFAFTIIILGVTFGYVLRAVRNI